MDLKEYERFKFDLANLVRAAELVAPDKEESSGRWRDLLTRLAEDRFTVVVAGRFSRGKSSLMNAVLGVDRLPTGVVPLTSVITYVRYGTSEQLVLAYKNGLLPEEARLEDLAAYVTEHGNPGNVKGIRCAEIQLPVEILRRGFFFVDTPGLGSAIFENTQTTERFIPEIDMLILVTGFESPLSEDELRFLQQASATARAVFIVINKQDLAPPLAREEVVEYIKAKVRTVLGARLPRVFSVSARDGLAAKRANDAAALRNSGIQDLETALVDLLAHERARLFLSSMCDRVGAELDGLPEKDGSDLASRLRDLTGRIGAGSPSEGQWTASGGKGRAAEVAVRRTGGCEVCRGVLDEQFRFLAKYQVELSKNARTWEEHAEQGGFCPMHTWHYEQITSLRGVCIAYPPLLVRTGARLRSLAAGESSTDCQWIAFRCPVCRLQQATEGRLIDSILARAAEAVDREAFSPPLCLPHLKAVLKHSKDSSLNQHLLLCEAARLERIAEDMQRYAVKHDGLRRNLASEEERTASLRALEMLAGHRNVSAVATIRDHL